MTISRSDPDVLIHKLAEAGNVWADADAAYCALDDVTKSILSECRIEVSKIEGVKTEAEKEARARVAEKFLKHLVSVSEARKARNRARVRYDVVKTYVEMWRTLSANRRAEQNLV